MEWFGGIRCEKFQNDFMTQTCALIAPAQPNLHQVSCSNETIQNAPKHYEMQQYMSLGSNGVGLGAFVAQNSKMTSWHKLLR